MASELRALDAGMENYASRTGRWPRGMIVGRNVALAMLEAGWLALVPRTRGSRLRFEREFWKAMRRGRVQYRGVKVRLSERDDASELE